MSQRQITRAAVTVMAAFLLSNLTGLVRQMLVAGAFGTSPVLDAFTAAARFPDILFNLVAGGALASAFVPTFTSFITHEDRAGAWRLASGVLVLASVVLAIISALAALGAPWVVGIIAPGLTGETRLLAESLLRILLISPTIFGVSGLLMGILNVHQHFLLPALASTCYWLGMIFGLLVWAPGMGIYGLAWGAVLGSALHLVVQLPALRRLPHSAFTFTFGLDNRAVREVMVLMGPRLLGVAAVQLNFLVSTALATYRLGGASALDYAWRVFTMPQVIIAQAIAIVALPAFSAMAARGEITTMRASLADTMRLILFLAIPATVGLLLLGNPIIALLFERGQFDGESTGLVTAALMFFTLGLVSHSIVEILSRSYYALKDTWTPVWVGVAAMLLNTALNFPFSTWFGAFGISHAGLAFANTVATTLEMLVLVWLLRRRLAGLDFARLWPSLWRTTLAAGLMAAGLFVWVAVTVQSPTWLIALGGVVLGGLVFWLAAAALRTPEARLLPEAVLRRIRPADTSQI